MKISIEKFSCELGSQNFTSGNDRWSVSRLIELSKDLEVFEIPLSGLNIYNLQNQINTMREFIAHVKRMQDADLKYPIILDDEGYVMDGRHRIAKALLQGKETIKAVRFVKTPTPCGYIEGKT